jgi:hypothetical protein
VGEKFNKVGKGLTGLFVVPDVYSIMPACPASPPSSGTCSCADPPWCFSSSTYVGLESSFAARTSSAFFANFSDDTRRLAPDWFRMYCSSAAGKPGERGSAMARAARAARRVTTGVGA